MIKIYLSPSFQDHNTGVGEYGTEERRCNEIADVVERELKKSDKFVVIRNKPEMSLLEVIRDSNKNNPDIHFSIHTNAGANTARGCEVYAYKPNTKGDKLAQIVYRRLSAITPPEDRGVKYNSLAETTQTKAIAVLTEVSFHSNKEDAEWIINNIEKIGQELAMSLYEYYGIEYNENQNPTCQENRQVGSTKSIEDLAHEVIAGKYGVGDARKKALGSLYNDVQAKVNEILLGKKTTPKKSNEQIADEVIAGKWGNGSDRKTKLKNAGYDYNAIQKIVNRKLR